jgi:hypothetical protein
MADSCGIVAREFSAGCAVSSVLWRSSPTLRPAGATGLQQLCNSFATGAATCYEYLWFFQLAATSIDHWSSLLQLHLAGDLKSSLAAPNMAPGNLAPQLHPFGSENSPTTTGQGVGHWSSGPQRTRTATDVCWCIVDVLKCS